MTKQHKLLSLAACMSAALVASSAMAAETPAAQTSAKEVLPRTLEGYVSQDKAFWDYLKANHPYFKYLKEGRVVGKFTMSDREEEWVDFGGGDILPPEELPPTEPVDTEPEKDPIRPVMYTVGAIV